MSFCVFQSTAVLNFRPKAKDKLLSCTLQTVEVFSCSLSAEEETALSIIDPLTIHIDLNANPLPEPKLSSSAGLLEASKVQERNLQLEVRSVVSRKVEDSCVLYRISVFFLVELF